MFCPSPKGQLFIIRAVSSHVEVRQQIFYQTSHLRVALERKQTDSYWCTLLYLVFVEALFLKPISLALLTLPPAIGRIHITVQCFRGQANLPDADNYGTIFKRTRPSHSFSSGAERAGCCSITKNGTSHVQYFIIATKWRFSR